MADRQLYQKLGKLLEAASKQAAGRDAEYREYCFSLIDDKFWQIQNLIKTDRHYCGSLDGNYEENMRAVYNSYTENLWLMDVIDEVNDDDEIPDSDDTV